MDRWDQKRYEQEKRSFIQRRINQAPLWTQFTFLFGISWGAAWFCSWFIWRLFAQDHAWASSLPIRYTIAFLFAYGCFFIAVRVWIGIVKREPNQQGGSPADLIDGANASPADAEGCFIFLALAVIGFIVGGVFLAIGGAPMLLEAAFEAAFAGVVVRRPLYGDFVLGNWKRRLLENTWKKALIILLTLIVMAAWLQHRAPQTSTLAQAISEISHRSLAPE